MTVAGDRQGFFFFSQISISCAYCVFRRCMKESPGIAVFEYGAKKSK
jgi:hypothetical protein